METQVETNEKRKRNPRPYVLDAHAEFGRFNDLRSRFALTRSAAYELIGEGKIKSVVLKKKGARAVVRFALAGVARTIAAARLAVTFIVELEAAA